MYGNIDAEPASFATSAGTRGSLSSLGSIVMPNLVFRPRLAASTEISGDLSAAVNTKSKSVQISWAYVHGEPSVTSFYHSLRSNKATTLPLSVAHTSEQTEPPPLFGCTSDSTTGLPSPSSSINSTSPSSRPVPLDSGYRYDRSTISTPAAASKSYKKCTSKSCSHRPVLQPRGPLAKKRTVSFCNRAEIIPQPTWRHKCPPPEKKKTSLKRKISACSLDDGYEASVESQLRETLHKRSKCHTDARRDGKLALTCTPLSAKATREKFIKQRIRQVRMSRREKAAIDDGMNFLNEVASDERALRSVWEKTGVNLRVLLTTLGGLAKLVNSERRV